MFSLCLSRISLSILQWYLILIVCQLQYVNCSNGETEVVKNLDTVINNSSYIGINSHNKIENVSIISTVPKISNDTSATYTRTYSNNNHYHKRFCKNNVFKRGLEEILLESQGRDKVSLDYLTKSIFDLSRRINEVLYRPNYNGNCNYDQFSKTLFSALQQMEGQVTSGFIEINSNIDRILKFVRSPSFSNSHSQFEGICYNEHLQKKLRNLVKQSTKTIVNSFKNIMEKLNKLSSLIKNGPQNNAHLSDEKCSYEYVRNDIIEKHLKLETDTGTAFYNAMRVVFLMTHIIGYELEGREQKDIKLIEIILTAVTDALENDAVVTNLSKTNESNNPPLPNSSDMFTNPYGCPVTKADKTNLRLSPKDQSGMREVVVLVLTQLLEEILRVGIDFLANAIFNTTSLSTLRTAINGTDLLQSINEDNSHPNCKKYYNELRDDIQKAIESSFEFGKEAFVEGIKFYRNISDLLSKQNEGYHILSPLFRISEWLSIIGEVNDETLKIINDFTPVFYTYIGIMEGIGQNIFSTFTKILNENCLIRLMSVFQRNLAMMGNITQSKHTRTTRDVGPLISKLSETLPFDLTRLGTDVKQRNSTTLINHIVTGRALSPAQEEPTPTMPPANPNVNDPVAEWINMLKVVSNTLLNKIRLLYNLNS